MPRVTAREGIWYGINFLSYLFVIILSGLLFFGFGVALLTQDAPAIGLLLMLVGILIFYAGAIGTVYKVIADGVTRGLVDRPTGPYGSSRQKAPGDDN